VPRRARRKPPVFRPRANAIAFAPHLLPPLCKAEMTPTEASAWPRRCLCRDGQALLFDRAARGQPPAKPSINRRRRR
jgi:hypothetical protein